jgi:hypothetical protein
VFGVIADVFDRGEIFILPMTGKTEVIVIIGFHQLRSTRSSVRVMAVKAGNLGLEVYAILEVDPLLVVGFGMGFRISP